MATPPQPSADLLPVGRQATPMFRLVRVTAGPLLHLVFHIEVEGRSNVPEYGTYVLIANHLNWLDSFLILATFPVEPKVHFLGETLGLVHRKVQWALVKSVGGFIPVNRQAHPDVVLFHHVNRCLQRGGVVAIYPEGHYGPSEGDVMPFKKGFAHFAIDNHAPVLPVALSGTKDLWLRKPVRMIIGTPIDSDGYTVDSLVVAAERAVRDLLPPYHEPTGPKLLRSGLTRLF